VGLAKARRTWEEAKLEKNLGALPNSRLNEKGGGGSDTYFP